MMGSSCSKLSEIKASGKRQLVVQSAQSRITKWKCKSFLRMALADTFTQSAIRFLNKSGDKVQFVGSSTDITERKQAQEKIRQSDRELRQLFFTPLHLAEFGPRKSRPTATRPRWVWGWPRFSLILPRLPHENLDAMGPQLVTGGVVPQFKSDGQQCPSHTS
jgi:hypothetical protein